ncbi:MAG TPA: hypothetical protein VEB20_26020 [Azospirillaceae bacterium]|nr:hypothetical protein [Azospirillaceae bacterium]
MSSIDVTAILGAIQDLGSRMEQRFNSVETKLGTLSERVARIEGQLGLLPNAQDFYTLKGRVDEISRAQPTTLAYAPPGQPR